MEKTASFAIIITFVVYGMVAAIFLLSPDTRWRAIESPLTGQCYEMYSTYALLGHSRAMAQIDDTFCDEKEGTE